TITVVNNVTGGDTTSPQTFTIADATLTARGQDTNPGAGVAFTDTEATFGDANSQAPLSDFSATIQWGDGQSSAGTVAVNGNGGYTVAGSHMYSAEGRYTVAVNIKDVGGATATATSIAHVSRTGPPPTCLGLVANALTHSAE